MLNTSLFVHACMCTRGYHHAHIYTYINRDKIINNANQNNPTNNNCLKKKKKEEDYKYLTLSLSIIVGNRINK